jgi:hypothetical protein
VASPAPRLILKLKFNSTQDESSRVSIAKLCPQMRSRVISGRILSGRILSGRILPCFYPNLVRNNSKRCAFRTNPPCFPRPQMRSSVLSGPILPCFYRETLPANAKRCAFRTNLPCFHREHRPQQCQTVCFQDQSSLFPSRTSPATMPNSVLSGPIFLVSIRTLPANAKRRALKTQRRTEPWARTRKNHHKTVDVLPNLH